MQDSISDLLRSLGLSEKEAQMYMMLLRHGTHATSTLATKAHMNRGTAYVILHALLQKGLAAKSVRKSLQFFSPTPPEQLLRYLDHEQQRIATNRRKAEVMMGMLEAIRNPQTTAPKIEFFEGVEGARTVLETTLAAQDKTLRAFLSIADVIDFLGGDFFEDYTGRRIAAGYSLRAIRTLEKDKAAFAKDPRSRRYVTSVAERREVRYAPEELAFPMTMYMFDTTLAVISSAQENFALRIESKEFADMQKKLFALLWPTLQKQVKSTGLQ
jgi:HTH-type transcriptional regulator, sugar sensing transcriptional regulator